MRVRPRFWRCCVTLAPDDGQGDVRHRILDPVVVPGRAHAEVASRGKPDSSLAADEALRSELVVGERQHGANAELPVQLVQRRGAESPAEISPHAHPVGHVIERGDARD